MPDQKLIKDVLERALWTAAQTFIAVYTVGGIDEALAFLRALQQQKLETRTLLHL
jgi:hypothetical protein